ncbi:MAG: segregation/condensation protein A [Pelagibacteraceae bacterium]|jgi:segregation and condensation protein A|nr:segregation/condensation protein A [Pelagibacteraceae bacterium]HJO13259.1 ScpA family protein [Alphaproteobacteria bacterium]MBO6466739.1 segregation/condensation protein A [Pelagibacteraceae bacterium]MBO6467724.1 segregation/condensation protein A [Pelagibacteraceae bacterium]MBO6468578.1 segregation/condensation protein A [Pelagibacteraceae bacterium]|tara:strand:+ start:863 stop:1630 length:768 start_codon:yes stop_codon:yes gene_type:complete
MFSEENNTSSYKDSQFYILLNGYEGPIDLLLELSRKQKVDLSEISILDLAEQYLKFIENYSTIHLEIAADYLVMAAWLTYLKSRLLLPKDETTEEYTPEELEEALRYQLQRLEAMQKISKKLYSKPLIGRDVFYGGSTEGINIKYNITYTSSMYDLLNSYSLILKKNEQINHLTINPSELYSVDQAIQRLKGIFGSITEWTNFMNLIPKFGQNQIINKSSITSNFVASLELAKNGFIDVKQNETFGNIFLKSRKQ